MKKIVRILSIMLVLALIFTISLSKNAVYAEEVSFNDFSFTSSKMRENGKMKVIILLEWETTNEIAISSITTEINGQTQTNEKPKWEKVEVVSNDENGEEFITYKYSVEYVVEHWQIGTMNLYIKYLNVNDAEEYVKEYCVAGGKWLSEEVNWNTAVFYGIFVTICVVLGTYIIIETSKKGYLNSDSEE